MAAPLQSTAPSGAPDPVVPPSSRSPSPQRYCLKWNNYQSNVTSTFKELLEVEDFVDITLMAEGGTLRAHKVVLSACSPYFRDILKGIAAWQHPVIVLKDVPFSHLQGIVEFIYHGEVSVDQTSLDFFLNTAQLLRVKGLADDAFTNNNSQDFCKQPARPSTHMHHPRKSLRPTRALIKRDIVPSESMREIGPNPSKRTATDDDSILVIDELKQDCSQDTDKDKNGSDGSEEEEIDDVEEDDEGESGDEEEEEISPLIAASSQHKSNNSMSQDWDNPDEKKQRNLLMSMSGGGLSIVPKFFEQSFGLTQLQNFDENSSPAIPSTSEGEPGGSGGAGQKKTCPYCFQQLSWHALSRHIRDMHRAKTGYVTCKFCFKMFRNKNSLGCHMWRFHKDAKDQRVDEPSVKNDESGAVSM